MHFFGHCIIYQFGDDKLDKVKNWTYTC